MTTVTIHQLGYLPWLGFFDKMAKADIFVLYDDARFEKNYFDNRNKIKTAQGWTWITVPVKYKFGQKLNEVEIENTQRWREKHYKTFLINYNKAPFSPVYLDFFEKIYKKKWERLVDLDITLIKYFAEKLGIKTELIKSSELNCTGEKSQKLLNICKKLNADIYLSGKFGKNYLDEKLFKENNIKVIYQDFKHPIYPQLYGEFIPELSVVDLLFNCGPSSLNILLGEKSIYDSTR